MAEAIDFIPQQMFPPGSDVVPRRRAARGAAGQHAEAGIVDFVQMKDAFDPADRHEHAGQKTTLQRTVLVRETLPGDVPPMEHLRHQQEGPGILGVSEKKFSGGVGRDKPLAGGCSRSSISACSSSEG